MIPLELIHRLADLGVEALTIPLDESDGTRRLFLELDDLWSRFLEARQLEVKKCPHALLEPSSKGQRCASCHWLITSVKCPKCGGPKGIALAAEADCYECLCRSMDALERELSLPETVKVERILPTELLYMCLRCGGSHPEEECQRPA